MPIRFSRPLKSSSTKEKKRQSKNECRYKNFIRSEEYVSRFIVKRLTTGKKDTIIVDMTGLIKIINNLADWEKNTVLLKFSVSVISTTKCAEWKEDTAKNWFDK